MRAIPAWRILRDISTTHVLNRNRPCGYSRHRCGRWKRRRKSTAHTRGTRGNKGCHVSRKCSTKVKVLPDLKVRPRGHPTAKIPSPPWRFSSWSPLLRLLLPSPSRRGCEGRQPLPGGSARTRVAKQVAHRTQSSTLLSRPGLVITGDPQNKDGPPE